MGRPCQPLVHPVTVRCQAEELQVCRNIVLLKEEHRQQSDVCAGKHVTRSEGASVGEVIVKVS